MLDSLSASERDRIAQVAARLSGSGCIDRNEVKKVLTEPLFDKLMAVGRVVNVSSPVPCAHGPKRDPGDSFIYL